MKPYYVTTAITYPNAAPHLGHAYEYIATDAIARFTVETSVGTIRAHRIVDACGAWANDIAGLVGIRLPLRAEGLHLNVTEPRERVLEPMVQHIGRRLTLKQASNGTFIIGGGWPAAPEPPPRRFSTTWESTCAPVVCSRKAEATCPSATRAAVSRAEARSRIGRASSKAYFCMPTRSA